MEGVRGRPSRGTVYREVWRVQDGSKRKNRRKGLASAKKKGERGEAFRYIGGLREDIGMKTYLHGPMDYAKKLTLRNRVGDMDLPERRKRYTSSWEEEDVATNMCPCGTTIESTSQYGIIETGISRSNRFVRALSSGGGSNAPRPVLSVRTWPGSGMGAERDKREVAKMLYFDKYSRAFGCILPSAERDNFQI